MKHVLLLLAVLMIFPMQNAMAGKLYAREPGKASPVYNLQQVYINTQVTIHDRLAVTHVDESFSNSSMLELEGFYVFELPDKATIDGLWMWVDGKRITFVVKRKEEAQHIYDSLTQNNIGDPVILESLSANRFQMRIHPIRPGQIRRIELRYFELLPVNMSGVIRYVYPLNMSGYQTSPVQQMDLTIDLHMGAPIDFTKTNFDDRPLMTARTEHSESHHTVHVSKEDILLAEDFALEYGLAGWSDSLFVLSHGEIAAPDSSTFLAWFADTLDVSTDVKTDFIFAIDASGSMTGLRSTMVWEAMGNILSRLMPSDRFHVILFNEKAVHYPADTSMQFATPAAILTAMQTLSSSYSPRGITDYDVALSSLSSLSLRPEASARCIFITDGMPNSGNDEAEELFPYLRIGNTSILFYPVTIYTEQREVLYDLAQLTGGRLCALEQGMDFEDALRRTTFAFEASLVDNVWMEYPPGVSDVYPFTPVSSGIQSFTGSGRFGSSVTGECSLHFSLPGVPSEITVTRPIALVADTSTPVQIARYWAAQRIDQLLRMLRDVEDSTEIREAVIRLSEKYMLLSPFTAFIVFHDPDDPTSAAGELPMPERLQLEQNYPNPFNPSTTIRFTIPQRSSAHGRRVVLSIYDALGRRIRVLSDKEYASGTYELQWDGCDDFGRRVASGTYYASLTFDDERQVITMTLLK